MAQVVSFAEKPRITLEVVTDGVQTDTTPPSAVRVTQVADIPSGIIRLLAKADDAMLLVYWDEEEETKRAVRLAHDQGIKVCDMCDVLTRIKATSPDNSKETVMAAPKVHTIEELTAMDTPELEELAEELGIDHTVYEDWNDVFPVIVDAESKLEGAADVEVAGDGEAEPEAEDVAPDDEQEARPYSRDELTEIGDGPGGLETLKGICEYNGIPIPGVRPKKLTLVNAILAWQDENSSEGEVEGETLSVAVAEEADIPDDDVVDVETLVQVAVDQAIGRLEPLFGLVEGLSEELGSISAGIAKLLELAETRVVAPEPAKAVSPTKKAAARVIGVRPIRRP